MEPACGSLPGLMQTGGNADVLHARGVEGMAQRCEPFACWISSLVCDTDHGDEGNTARMETKEPSAKLLADATLKLWQNGVDQAGKLFSGLTEEALEREVAPGKNRLIYLWGHLLAVSDALYAVLRLGERLHPELDAMFLKNADRAVTPIWSAQELKAAWGVVHERLRVEMAKLSAEEWLERHALVSEEAFAKEPHRNRFTVLLARSGHLAYHFGQARLAK